MRFGLLLAGLLALTCRALAWDQFDYEIFDLVSALETAEGKGVSFYSFLNVSSNAPTSEISKQYRKRSLELHPDKNPNVKNAHERFARLGTIANILRDDSQRSRYDYFYRAGVPKWRGTGYYYSRYRPGIILVVIGLAAASCGIQYLVQRLNFFLAKQRLDNFRRRALRQAYGENSSTKGREARRLRLRIPKTELAEDRNNAFLIAVQGEDVYLVDEETKEEHILDDSQLPRAAFSNTWLPGLILSIIPLGSGQGKRTDVVDDTPLIEIEPETGDSSALATRENDATTKRRKGKR